MKQIIAMLFPSLTASFYKIAPARLTTETALAGINKILTDLRKVKEIHDAEEKAQLDAASIAATKANEAQREAVKAATVLAKFEALVG